MTQESHSSLADQVRYLSDRQAILDCINRYCFGVDRHDKAMMMSAFHPDGLDEHGPYVGDPAGFAEWANTFHSEFVAHTHNITSHACEIEGDTAHAQTYCLYGLRRRDSAGEGATVLFGCARYIDRLERRDGQWRIKLRKVLIEWRGDLPSVMRAGYPTGTWDQTDPSYDRPLAPTPRPPDVQREA
jgi:hypothetical protein